MNFQFFFPFQLSQDVRLRPPVRKTLRKGEQRISIDDILNGGGFNGGRRRDDRDRDRDRDRETPDRRRVNVDSGESPRRNPRPRVECRNCMDTDLALERYCHVWVLEEPRRGGDKEYICKRWVRARDRGDDYDYNNYNDNNRDEDEFGGNGNRDNDDYDYNY